MYFLNKPNFMNLNQKAPENDPTITSHNKKYIGTNQILYDEIMEVIKSNMKSKVVSMIIETYGVKGWADQLLKEIVIKEMAQKGWGWSAGNYVHGVTDTIEFVFIGIVSYKGAGIPSILMEPLPC